MINMIKIIILKCHKCFYEFKNPFSINQISIPCPKCHEPIYINR